MKKNKQGKEAEGRMDSNKEGRKSFSETIAFEQKPELGSKPCTHLG